MHRGRKESAYILCILESLEPLKELVRLRCLLRLRIKLPVAGLKVQTLRGWRYHPRLLLREESDLLLLDLSLLLLDLLLLQELYLRIDLGNGLGGCRRGHHGRRYRWVRRARRDGWHAALHGRRRQDPVCPSHGRVQGIAMRRGQQVGAGLVLEVKVELHAVA